MPRPSACVSQPENSCDAPTFASRRQSRNRSPLMNVRVPRIAALLVVFSFTACVDPRGGEDGGTQTDAGTPDAGPPPDPCSGACAEYEACEPSTAACVLSVAPRCTAGTAWSPGVKAFVEASAEMGI